MAFCPVFEKRAETDGAQGFEILCELKAGGEFAQLDFGANFVAQNALFGAEGEFALFIAVTNMVVYKGLI